MALEKLRIASRRSQLAMVQTNWVKKELEQAHPELLKALSDSAMPIEGDDGKPLGAGDFFEISNITASNFQIHFKNSSNASISKQFTFTAVGFGKG